MVRFTKPVFHGRQALLRLQQLGPRSRLVGFQFSDRVVQPGDNDWARRLEGCQVVEQGRPAGRVTSARFSPTLEKYVGLAWVPAGRSHPGGQFLIHSHNTDLSAMVTPIPFYDPQGERLKS
jgi:sarcosine oxidase subunit alpha